MFRTSVQNNRDFDADFDVAVVGGGLAGVATALRLQAAGLSTVVIEAHGHLGGCAGYWRHKGFSFDVGATTLVDFEPGGVGAELFSATGMPPLAGEALPGYAAWLPDRRVSLHRDQPAWHAERLRAFGDDPAHRRFWSLLDQLAAAFWSASRRGVRLPLRSAADLVQDVRILGPDLRHVRHLGRTLGGALRHCGLSGDRALRALLGMLVEDTVHSTVDRAPLINAALGVTIRGAGLTRATGGMHGFWRTVAGHYRSMGGVVLAGSPVSRVDGSAGGFTLTARRGPVHARRVVFAVPAPTAARLHEGLGRRLGRYLRRDADELGGAVLVFLGVPADEVAGSSPAHEFTHHQLLESYDKPMGDGNNMFVSVSAPGDLLSAPADHRAVMISTHTSLAGWRLPEDAYQQRKKEITEHLVTQARRVYPRLGERAVVTATGTPRTYERFGFRPQGAVGGPHQTLRNTNQYAIPHDLGGRGIWLVGDSTWPGLGTVACVLGSRIVADGILREKL